MGVQVAAHEREGRRFGDAVFRAFRRHGVDTGWPPQPVVGREAERAVAGGQPPKPVDDAGERRAGVGQVEAQAVEGRRLRRLLAQVGQRVGVRLRAVVRDVLRDQLAEVAGAGVVAAERGEVGQDEARRVQVAEHDREQQRGAAGQPRVEAACWRFIGWRVRFSPGGGQVEGDREGGAGGEGEQRRNNQVIGDGRDQTQQQHRRAGQHEAEVVVVEEAASVPRVDGRKDGAAQDAVEVGEVHRLLIAELALPQVGVDEAYDQQRPKRGQRDDFEGQQRAAMRTDVGDDFGRSAPDDHRRDDRQQRQPQQQAALRPQRQPQACAVPAKPGDQQQADPLGEAVAPVGQTRRERVQQRPDQPADDDVQQPPDGQTQRRLGVDGGLAVETLGPGPIVVLERANGVGVFQAIRLIRRQRSALGPRLVGERAQRQHGQHDA